MSFISFPSYHKQGQRLPGTTREALSYLAYADKVIAVREASKFAALLSAAASVSAPFFEADLTLPITFFTISAITWAVVRLEANIVEEGALKSIKYFAEQDRITKHVPRIYSDPYET